jgi:peptide/nickel transport system substrate-binding protein
VRVRIAVAAILLCAVLPRHAPAADEPKAGGILRYAVTGDATTYDCHATDAFPAIHFLAPQYSTLLRMDPEHWPQVTGDVADSWEVRDEGRTYVFHLHRGIRFHNGSPLGAADVKASFDRVREPPPGVVSARKALYEDVASIDAPDDRTVVFRLKQPNAAMLTLLASPWNCIYSSKLLKENPDYPAGIVMGSGPFRFVQYVRGSKWVGRRFEGYFRSGLPYLDGFEAYVLSNAGLMSAIQGGQVMVEFRGISPAQRDALKHAMGERIKFQEIPRLANFQLAFNTTRKPFDDVRVRRALSMAIDRWAFEQQLRRTTVAGLVGGLLRPGYPMARSAEELERFPGFSRDATLAKAEAKRLLKEAGQENLSFKLTNLAGGNPHAAIGVYAIDQWRQIGVSVEQEEVVSPAWHAARFGGNFDVITDFVADFADEPVLQLAHYLSHDRAPDNVSRAIDRTLDALYERQLRIANPSERLEVVHAFEERVLRQAYVAPISWGYRIVPLAAEVKGYVITPSTHTNQDLATIWLDR